MAGQLWQIDRRMFLKSTAAVAGLAAVSPWLAACGSTSSSKNNPEKNKQVKLPTYLPWQGKPADLPASGNVLAGYFDLPQNPVVGVPDKPGSGGSVSVMVSLFGPVPPSLSANPYWRSLNDQLGVDLKLNMVPDSSYTAKSATTLAGGDIPDIMQLRTDQPQRPQILQSLFADLTEYLSGDAIKDYPFLANLPTYAWPDMVSNGGIYALPTPRAPVGSIMFMRTDIIEAAGLNPNPGSFKEFSDLCKGLTDPKHDRWALGGQLPSPGAPVVGYVMQMTGAPNMWAQDGGKFTYAYESDAARQAVSAVRDLVKAGVFHPDSFSGNADVRQLLGGGKVVLNRDGNLAWDILATTYPQARFGAQVPPKFDGGGDARVALGATTFAYTALKKASKSRIQELLRVCNWLAAPVGTKEYLFRKFGDQGRDYTMQGSLPTLTDKGKTETGLPLSYIVDSAPVLGPGPRDRIQAEYDYQKRVGPTLREDASVGLFSATDSSQGPKLRKALLDVMSDVLQGRKSLSDWDDAVKTWRGNGGDAIRHEYETQFATAH